MFFTSINIGKKNAVHRDLFDLLTEPKISCLAKKRLNIYVLGVLTPITNISLNIKLETKSKLCRMNLGFLARQASLII